MLAATLNIRSKLIVVPIIAPDKEFIPNNTIHREKKVKIRNAIQPRRVLRAAIAIFNYLLIKPLTGICIL